MSKAESAQGCLFNRWDRYFYQLHKDILLWLLVFLFNFLFRFVFVAIFHASLLPSSGFHEIAQMTVVGLRYDARLASFWIVIPFLSSIASVIGGRESIADHIRTWFAALFSIPAGILSVLSIGFYREYHEPLNTFLFNLYYDDSRAILATIWAGYHPLIYIASMGAVAFGTYEAGRRVIRRGALSPGRIAFLRSSPFRRAAVLALILILFVFGLRGGTLSKDHRISMLRESSDGVTNDVLLNKAIPNPFVAFGRAYHEQRDYAGTGALNAYLPDGDVGKAAQALFPGAGNFRTLDDFMRHTAVGPGNPPPQHVILIVAESCDSWPMEARFAELQLTPNLEVLSRKGLSVTSFVPSAHLTMQSFGAILTSIPYTDGPRINYQSSSHWTYPSSLPAAFKRLGYRTRFFYGGRLSWERIDNFARDQGFDEVYGAPDIRKALGKVEEEDWGVLDEYLYRFTTKMIAPKQPSFDVILTTTNHSPYQTDMWSKGYAIKSLPPELAETFDGTGNTDLRVEAHRWYSDRCLGNFVREMEGRLPQTLFAVTGDHFSRLFPNARPTFYEQSAVPFVLYGKDVLRGLSLPRNAAGSHIDIAPTLIERAAPRGFVYYAMGQDLLAPHPHPLGIGYFKVIGPDFIADMNTMTFHRVPGKPLPRELPDIASLKSIFNDYWGVAWWRVRYGAALPGPKQPTVVESPGKILSHAFPSR